LLSKDTKSDHKYSKIVTIFTTLFLATSGLVLSAANAVAFDENGDGLVLCSGGGTFTITNYVATDGNSCIGEAIIPEGVTGIDDNFRSASYIVEMTIPESVTSISEDALIGTDALAEFRVNTENLFYSSEDGVLFDKLKTTLIQYPAAKAETSYIIPASVIIIDGWAFENISVLETVTFASGSQILEIGDRAFENAFSLISITIPEGVTRIGNMAFDSAESLTSINLPASLLFIDDYDAFEYTALTSITIPANVTLIGPNAFGSAPLASVYFLGNAPAVEKDTFCVDHITNLFCSTAKAYIKSGATGFDLDTDGDGNSGVWYGLIVEIVADPVSDSSDQAPVIANGHRADRLGSVYFQPLSSDLSKAASKEIKTLVTANPAAIYKVIGYVQKSVSSRNDASLSLARAKAIETYLVSLSADVNFTVVLDAGLVPAKNGTNEKARRATLYAMTPVVQ
jgi:hypothetical protein